MKRRIVALTVFMVLFFFAVNSRIAYLVLNPDAVKAESTHGTCSLSLQLGRGTVYDTNMLPIVNRKLKYIAAVSPQYDAAVQLNALKLHAKNFTEAQDNFNKGKPFTTEVDTPNIDAQGIEVFTVPERYSDDALCSHIIGYTNSENKGVSGIEKAFDDVLSGYSQSVSLTYSVDAKRRTLAGAEVAKTINGNYKGGVVLTIDREIQKSAQEATAKYLKDGSAIVMDVSNGDILAAVSMPTYSPTNVGVALKQENSPLLNRVFTSYNLGSAFKIVTTCAALEKDIPDTFKYKCTGVLDVSGRDFHCEHLVSHGEQDMSMGFANSCNTYYITLGLGIGAEKLHETALSFGFGRSTVFAPGLSSDTGIVPSLGQLSSPASIANFSIGQGELMVTPVQVACMVSSVANGGKLPTAHLVKGVYDGEKIIKSYPNAVADRVISEEISQKVSSFMIKTVETGTGQPAMPVYGGAGGKTATAETGWAKDGKVINQAWFAGFYPADKPKYAIVVMCENGSAGGKDAGPVFKYIADSLSQKAGFPKVDDKDSKS